MNKRLSIKEIKNFVLGLHQNAIQIVKTKGHREIYAQFIYSYPGSSVSIWRNLTGCTLNELYSIFQTEGTKYINNMTFLQHNAYSELEPNEYKLWLYFNECSPLTIDVDEICMSCEFEDKEEAEEVLESLVKTGFVVKHDYDDGIDFCPAGKEFYGDKYLEAIDSLITCSLDFIEEDKIDEFLNGIKKVVDDTATVMNGVMITVNKEGEPNYE